VIQTPYLVTTELGQGVFRAAEERGVEVRILTNSLAATDNLMAFSGYVRGRQALLDAGVDLFESKPRMAAQTDLMNGPLAERYGSRMALHAKSMVVDGKISVVGSFNLDPRSAHLNTESVTIIHSEEVAKHLLTRMETEMSEENAWHRTQSFNPDNKARLLRRFSSLFVRHCSGFGSVVQRAVQSAPPRLHGSDECAAVSLSETCFSMIRTAFL
jgi:phosphatidylserine/phosphatidylglycerophosphate/cardiolipin synthase-like enzyme